MRRPPRLPIALLASAFLAIPAAAQEETPEAFESKLGYRSGHVVLDGGFATLEVPESFRFIGPEGSRRLLEQAWGNPPGSAEGVLGMLVPASLSPLADKGWGVVISFEDDGWVNDEDAATIDYPKLLREMQEGATADNDERRRAGFPPVRLVGWAEPPSYNAQSHKLYWAKELAFGEGDQEERTLNYNVRVLGRRGVLVLNAVAAMDQLPAVRTDMQQVLGFVEFNEGHRYTDYVAGTDKAAAYGIAGLVAGGVAAKAGLFKGLIALLVAGKKLVLVAVVAIGAWLKRLLGKGDQASSAG